MSGLKPFVKLEAVAAIVSDPGEKVWSALRDSLKVVPSKLCWVDGRFCAKAREESDRSLLVNRDETGFQSGRLWCCKETVLTEAALEVWGRG